MQSISGESRLVLGTTKKDVLFEKAPKRLSNNLYSVNIEGYSAILSEDVGFGARSKATAIVKFDKGNPRIADFRSVRSGKEISLFSKEEVSSIGVDIIPTGTKEVVSSYPVRAHIKTIIKPTSRIELDFKEGRMLVEEYPFVSAKDFKVRASLRTTKKTIDFKPFDIKPFAEEDFFVGEGVLEKIKPKKTQKYSKLSKPVDKIVFLADDTYISFEKKFKPFELGKELSKAEFKVSETPSLLIKEKGVVKKKTVSKPVINIGKQESSSVLKGFYFSKTTGDENIIVDVFPRDNSILGQPQKNIITQKQNIFVQSLISIKSKNSTKQVLDIKNNIISRRKTFVSPIVNVSQPQKDIKKSIINTKNTPDVISSLDKDIISDSSKYINKKKPRRLKLPSFSFPSDEEPSLNVAFGVAVKKKGFFETIATGLTKEEALFKGSSVVGTTSSATFKIFSSGKTSEVGGRGLINKNDFYSPKKDFFVEKRSRRIKSKGELQEITFKGLSTLKNKKGGFNFGI